MNKTMKYSLPVFILLFYTAIIVAQDVQQPGRIRDVVFHGLGQLSLDDAQRMFGLEKGAAFNPADLIERGKSLLRGYEEQHMVYARIDSIVYKMSDNLRNVDIQVYVREEMPLTLGAIHLSGADSMTIMQLRSRFDSKVGQAFEQKKVEMDIGDALLQLEKYGYPFCRFELQQVTIDPVAHERKGFGIDWKIIPGPQLFLREILITGNKITKEKVILREIRIKPGERYHPNKLARVQSRLMKTGHFTRVSEPEVYLSSGQDGGMLIQVEEGTASRFDGVVGYNPGSGSEEGYFTGLIDISLGNLFGTGRALQAHWQKRDRKTQSIKIYYREPWLAGYPVHVGFGFMQLIQDTTYVQREIICDLNLPLYENLAVTAKLNRVEVSPDSLGSYRFGLLHSRTFSASIGLQYDSRDDRINPQRGVLYQTMFENGSKRNFGPPDLIAGKRKQFTNRRMTLDFEFYTVLFKRQILAWFLHGGQISSNEKFIPQPDQFRLGGTNSLRGYREDQFRGTEVAWTTLEYRYWLGRRSRAFIFADYGYYGVLKENNRAGHYKLGYGVGVRLQTGLGVMGIDYGLGHDDDLLNGKIHVGLINEF